MEALDLFMIYITAGLYFCEVLGHLHHKDGQSPRLHELHYNQRLKDSERHHQQQFQYGYPRHLGHDFAAVKEEGLFFLLPLVLSLSNFLQ